MTILPWSLLFIFYKFFFGFDGDKAQQIMLAVHTHGKGVCGIFTREVAETKSAQINNFAKENGHPLLSDIEEVGEDD
jgi:ATP-dependent Clp protease adaptor protein ClpS